MLQKLILGAFLALPLAGLAQQPKLESGQLLNDVRILAADSMEGRRVATAGSQMAQDYIISRFRQVGLKPYGNSYKHPFTFTRRDKQTYQGTNLIGYIPGKSGKAIVISAHYDHEGVKRGEIFNGADDNASGVGALLAIAAYFKNNPPQHTLIFLSPDAEEMGLQGANAFLDNPSVPLDKILLNVNMDMLGVNDKGELYASGTYHYPELKTIVDKIAPRPNAKLKTGHDKPEEGPNDWTRQSDHYQFHKRGIPYLYFGVEDHPYYHRPTDDFEHIKQQFYPDAAALVLDFILLADKHAHKLPARKHKK
ncbi:M28 family peptidase [Pontibacter sp. Tf4]|uniref:M28 family peptidase n=1 Tax=Pontibacter sp. Tf4 TaxID=2761620 RepID=UPI0016280D31|nr:M28 family peptidase [Pontibacter sp. Tf4]MBB6610762.1 M28 family peptidase [Pontibacter sp. Tf4]